MVQTLGQNHKLSELVPQPSPSIFVSHYPNNRTWIPSTYWTLGEAPVISSSELPDCHGQPTYEEQRLNVFNLTAVQSKATDFFPPSSKEKKLW